MQEECVLSLIPFVFSLERNSLWYRIITNFFLVGKCRVGPEKRTSRRIECISRDVSHLMTYKLARCPVGGMIATYLLHRFKDVIRGAISSPQQTTAKM